MTTMTTTERQREMQRNLQVGKPNLKAPFPQCCCCGGEVPKAHGLVWQDDDGPVQAEGKAWSGGHLHCLKTAAGTLNRIKGSGRTGDVVLNNQELGTDHGFEHVSATWLRKCLNYDQARESLTIDAARMTDIRCPMDCWLPTVNGKGVFALQFRPTAEYRKQYVKHDGAEFVPNEYALGRLLSAFGLSGMSDMIYPSRTRKGETEVLYNTQPDDHYRFAEHLNATIFNADRFPAQNRGERLWRSRDDGTMRACLSGQYAILGNRWFLDHVAKLIPGGVVSHWRGDGDSMRFNVLVPDTLREADDSDYGGMVSCGNSEIGNGRLYTLPSVFRAICMNGCIWDRQEGIKHTWVHKGTIDTDHVGEIIATSIQQQLGLFNESIEQFLRLEERKLSVPLANVFAQLYTEYPQVFKRDLPIIASAYRDEPQLSAKGVVMALTRAGQQLPNSRWYDYDVIGGTIARQSAGEWSAFVNRADAFDEKKLEKLAIAL